MFDAAFKALGQMFSPPFRTVLLKSIGLAILLLILLGIGLHRLFAWLAGEGAGYLEGVTGPGMQTPLHVLLWMLAIMAGFGLAAGAIFIMPAVTAFVGELLLRRDRRRGRALALSGRSARHAGAGADRRPSKASRPRCWRCWSISARCRSCCSPASASSSSSWRTASCSAANISCSPRCASIRSRRRSALRKRHHGTIVLAGAFIAAFVSIPILNLATPLFGMAFMTHMHKKLAGPRRELIEHT